MKTTKKKEFVLSLIKDDIINTPLLGGLNANRYFIHCGQVIFHLMGISDDEKIDELNESFLRLAKRARFLMRCKTNKSSDDLAIEMYNAILKNINHSAYKS